MYGEVQSPADSTRNAWCRQAVIALVLCWILSATGIQAKEHDEAVSTLRSLSKAFTRVAEKATPAVVFIQVEQTVEAGKSPFEFNNPFDLFGEEFFERFFGPRSPRQRQPRQYRQQGQGSGFLISPDGYILTNHHVVGDADRITVTLADDREFTAKLIGADPKTDVAVIKIEGNAFPVLPTGDAASLEVGEWVVAIGNPFGLAHTTTVGVVSAKGRSRIGITDYEDFIQTDAAINPGNSGGPLINLAGEVVGINTAIFSRSGGYMGIGFAIPIDMAMQIQKQLVATGKVTRGYLGVGIQDLTPDLAKSFGLDNTEGVLIANVASGTPAAQAGLQTGDVLVAFNGMPIKGTVQLRNLVAQTPVGTQVKVKVVRNKTPRELTVKIDEMPDQTPTTGNAGELLDSLGLAIQDLTPELADRLGYGGQSGVVVAQVNPDSPAAEAGIRRGTLIQEVNQQSVQSTKDFMKALAESAKTKRVLLLLQDQGGTRFVALSLG